MAPSQVPCDKCELEVFGKQKVVCRSHCGEKSHAKCYDVKPEDILHFEKSFICKNCRASSRDSNPLAKTVDKLMDTTPAAVSCAAPMHDFVNVLNDYFAVNSTSRNAKQ